MKFDNIKALSIAVIERPVYNKYAHMLFFDQDSAQFKTRFPDGKTSPTGLANWLDKALTYSIPPKDKDPILFYDPKSTQRHLGFWDAVNSAPFQATGKRGNKNTGMIVEVIVNPESWMYEAKKKLED